MSTRQARRAEARGQGGPGGPNKHDPMRPVYIGFGVAIIIVILGFALFRFKQNQDVAVIYATPTPAATATLKPIPLKYLGSLGAKTFQDGNMSGGGNGNTVDGIQCEATEQAAIHIHSHLTLFVNGKQIAIPQFIGVVQQSKTTGCLYWLHTHGPDGIIHTEAPEIAGYTLGNFFHIWGASLSRNAIATFNGPVTAFVNGYKYDGDLASIPLTSHQQITLEVGSPIVPPPNYTFPTGI